MASEVGERVAATILEDREAEGHYRDRGRLSFYLLGSYVPGSGLYREAEEVADRLLEKLDEQDRLDVSELADLIDEWMGTLGAKRARAP